MLSLSSSRRRYLLAVLLIVLSFLGMGGFLPGIPRYHRGSSISSFHDFSWGTGLEELRTRLPDNHFQGQNPVESGGGAKPARLLTYDSVRVAGLKTTATFLLHPDHGLIKGTYRVPLRDRCKNRYERIEQWISRRYPMIPHTKRTLPSGETRVDCRAVRNNTAGRVTHWSSPGPGTDTITLAMGVGSLQRIIVLVESSQYKSWKEAPSPGVVP